MSKELQMLPDLISEEKDLNDSDLPNLSELLPFMRAFIKKEKDIIEQSKKENMQTPKEMEYKEKVYSQLDKDNKVKIKLKKSTYIRSPTSFR